jgi:hypothetical protein
MSRGKKRSRDQQDRECVFHKVAPYKWPCGKKKGMQRFPPMNIAQQDRSNNKDGKKEFSARKQRSQRGPALIMGRMPLADD